MLVARADADGVDVAAGHGVEPEGDVVAEHDVAHDVGAGGEIHPGAQGGPAPQVGMDGHRRILLASGGRL